MLRLWRLYAPPPPRLPIPLPTGKVMWVELPPPAGQLPEAGGYMDQAAAMMDAFAVMTAAANELKETTDGTEAGG